MRKRFELLPPEQYLAVLSERAYEISYAIKIKLKHIEKAPAGSLRVDKKNNSLQFYHVTSKKNPMGKYLTRSKDDFAKSLIQKSYDQKIVKCLEKELAAILKCAEICKKINLKSKKLLHKNRSGFYEEVTLADEMYAVKWLGVEYKKKKITEAMKNYQTSDGGLVRSKSEIIISETLKRMKIPFKYEVPVGVEVEGEFREFHPDFLCLNLRTRKEIVWEHFGMMDNSEYLENAIQKIQIYESNGYLSGENFIATFETSQQPLRLEVIERKIVALLK